MMNDHLDILSANILIVDDQEANVMLLEQMLSADGYRNITSRSEVSIPVRAEPVEASALRQAQREWT